MCQRACVYDGIHASCLCDDCMEEAYDLEVLILKDPELVPGHKPASDEEWREHCQEEPIALRLFAEIDN